MKTVNEILEKLDYCIAESEYVLNVKKQEKGYNYGMSAIQRTIEIEKLKTEIETYKITRMFIKL